MYCATSRYVSNTDLLPGIQAVAGLHFQGISASNKMHLQRQPCIEAILWISRMFSEGMTEGQGSDRSKAVPVPFPAKTIRPIGLLLLVALLLKAPTHVISRAVYIPSLYEAASPPGSH